MAWLEGNRCIRLLPSITWLLLPWQQQPLRGLEYQGVLRQRSKGLVIGETVTHWFPHGDHTMQPHDVGVLELAHDGRLPEEPHPVLLRRLPAQHLDGYVQVSLLRVPLPPAHGAKLTRAKVVLDPAQAEYVDEQGKLDALDSAIRVTSTITVCPDLYEVS